MKTFFTRMTITFKQNKMNKTTQNIALLTGVSLILVCTTYVFNLLLFSSNPRISPAEASFLEGMIFIASGALLLLGSGGIGTGSRSAAMLAAKAKAFNKDVVGPSEIYKRDAWKPKGFTRTGCILIITGIILLFIYYGAS